MFAMIGAVQLTSDPLPTGLVDSLGDAVRVGPDRLHRSEGDLRSTPFAPSCLMLADSASLFAAPASPRDSQARESMMLTCDGRIDNRDELASDCNASPQCTDAALVLAAYDKWHQQCFPRLVGDFAIVLWDAIRRELSLARDAFGTRPLFYSASGTTVIWSSELRTLVDATGSSPELDDNYAAGFLTGSEDRELTPYRGVRSVAPGALVVFSQRGVVSRPYWRPDPTTERSPGTDVDYEDRFHELLRDGIAARLRDNQPAFAELSGGLDSSSIVCLAADISARRRARLCTVTYLYPSSRTSDETRFRVEVEHKTGLPSVHLEDDTVITPIFDTPPPVAPNPTWLFNGIYSALGERMRAEGANLLLSGHGGDHLMMHAARRAPQLADLLRRGKLSTLVHHLHGYHTQWNRAYGQLIWTSVLWPLLPNKLRILTAGRRAELPRWFNRAFARRTGLAGRWMMEHGSGGFRTHSGEWQFGLLHDAITVASACYYRCGIGIDVTYPYLHRPLVELLMAMPGEQKVSHREMRSIQRRALRGVLPDAVRTRTSKSGLGEVLCRAVDREWSRIRQLTTKARIVEHGYVDRSGFENELMRVRHGVAHHVYPVSRALVLEAWLRARA